MPLRAALIFASPFLVVSVLVTAIKPTAGATILFFMTAVFAACMLSLVGDLSTNAGAGPPFGERRQLLELALTQKRPFAACVDCLSLVDEDRSECAYCGSKRGLTFIIDRRKKDQVRAVVPRHLH